ncbi:MAG TPA: DUF6680 family protein [Chitinophagaceae bacterium]|nr:DUF6680 family protein [Chitinophagaceae bacterium]
MSTTDILYVFVVPFLSACLGAFLTFRYQKNMERRREKRHIFQALMMYRNVGAAELDWIKALNVSDLIFHNHREVRVLLHKYFAYLREPVFSTGQHIDVLYDLLFAMAKASGYKSITLVDIRDTYSPNALDEHYPIRINRSAPPVPPPPSAS